MADNPYESPNVTDKVESPSFSVTIYNYGSALWIIAAVIIVLSWFNVVPITIGWIGFALALVGTIMSWIPRLNRPGPF